MKYLLFFLAFICSLNGTKTTLDLDKTYELTTEWCVFRGCRYNGSATLDISNLNLDSLKGISDLKISYGQYMGYIKSIERLRIIASGNNLKKIPLEITLLDIVSIDVNKNPDFKVPGWVFYKPNFYVYYSDSLIVPRSITF